MKSQKLYIAILAIILASIAIVIANLNYWYNGTWRAQATQVGSSSLGDRQNVIHEITLILANKEDSSLTWNINGNQREEMTGSFDVVGDYLIISRSKGEFVAFKIISKESTRMTAVSRTGIIFDFTKVE